MPTQKPSDATFLNPKDRYLGRSTLPTEDAQFEWTPKMVAEVKRCAKDLFYFAKEHFYIVTLDKGKIKIPLYAAQKRILRAFLKNRFVVTTASRQVGKSTILTLYALWLASFNEDYRILLVANKEDTAKKLFRKIRVAYEMIPNYLKPGVVEWGQTGMVLANGSSIGISTTTSDAARGEAANLLLVDELAYLQPGFEDEFWRSTVPIVSSSQKAKIFAVSTPNGTTNLFYRLYNGAVKGENGWSAQRIDWWEVPGRDNKWKKQQIKTLGSVEFFRQEFENVFLEDGLVTVDVDLLEKLKTLARPPKITLEDGDYQVFAEPVAGHLYTIGVDVSEGIGQNASVIQVVDITDLTQIEQAAVFHSNKIEPYTFACKVAMVANQWGRPPLLIERNNQGGQVIDALINTHQYSNLVDYTNLRNEKIAPNRRGIHAHVNSKAKAVTNMRYWLNVLRVVNLWDINTVHELETFIRWPNGLWRAKTGDNIFDDRVMALAWALFALDTDIATQYFDIETFDEKGKPLKLNSLEPMGDEYYKLDKSSQVDTGQYVVMPNFLGVAPGSGGQDLDIQELQTLGWEFPK